MPHIHLLAIFLSFCGHKSRIESRIKAQQRELSGDMMTIRKRSAVLLGVLGFLSGVAFAQYRRNRVIPLSRQPEKPIREERKVLPQVPMQVMDEPLATARRKKTDYTTH